MQSEIDLTHPIIHPSIWASGGATSISDGIILFVCYQWHFVLNTWSVHNLSTEMLNVKLRLQSKTFTLNSTKRKACKLWQFGELELRDMYFWRLNVDNSQLWTEFDIICLNLKNGLILQIFVFSHIYLYVAVASITGVCCLHIYSQPTLRPSTPKCRAHFAQSGFLEKLQPSWVLRSPPNYLVTAPPVACHIKPVGEKLNQKLIKDKRWWRRQQ